jgi:hypothetical protein
MTKKLFVQILIWISKKAEFDADFESVESSKKVYTKKVIGLRTFAHSTER